MSKCQLRVHSLPAHIAAEELSESVVVVIDLLRATSTICQALASGAREAVPFLEVEGALAAAAAAKDRSEIVLGGERKGGRIPGFDLGNSPSEYTPAAVSGRRLFITTTNGTRALFHARAAHRVLIGAIVNLSSVVRSLKNEPRVDILCAGQKGKVAGEDLLAAGAFVSHIQLLTGAAWHTNEVASTVRGEWEKISDDARALNRRLSDQLALELRDTPGGRNLLGIGLDQDLVDCAQIDRLTVVPELDVPAWRICLAQ